MLSQDNSTLFDDDTCLFVFSSGLDKVGGYSALQTKYMESVPNITETSSLYNTTCGQPREDSFSLLRDPWNSDYPWIGTLIFNIPSDIWFWCSDQVGIFI